MQVVRHNDKSIDGYPSFIYKETQAVDDNILPVIGSQQMIPVQAGGREELHYTMHA